MGNRHNYSKHYDQDSTKDFSDTEVVIATPEFEVVEEVKQEDSNPLMGEVSVEKLNIRSEPSSGANNVIRELSKGDVVEILQHMNDWYRVCTATGVEGYVMSQYIKVYE